MMTISMNHEESWLLLPWVANGRLPPGERARVEEHLRECAECTQELAAQRLMGQVLTAPGRVTYAPGPSFRKLMQRIDGAAAAEGSEELRPVRVPRFPARTLSAWRPPGVAFAASFVAALAVALVASTAYNWSQKPYATHTAAASAAPGVLHIAFERSLPVGEVEEALRRARARVVEGPDASGIFGVTTADGAQPGTQGLHQLAQRLRSDARVRWVQPLGAEPAPAAQGRRPQDP